MVETDINFLKGNLDSASNVTNMSGPSLPFLISRP